MNRIFGYAALWDVAVEDLSDSEHPPVKRLRLRRKKLPSLKEGRFLFFVDYVFSQVDDIPPIRAEWSTKEKDYLPKSGKKVNNAYELTRHK